MATVQDHRQVVITRILVLVLAAFCVGGFVRIEMISRAHTTQIASLHRNMVKNLNIKAEIIRYVDNLFSPQVLARNGNRVKRSLPDPKNNSNTYQYLLDEFSRHIGTEFRKVMSLCNVKNKSCLPVSRGLPGRPGARGRPGERGRRGYRSKRGPKGPKGPLGPMGMPGKSGKRGIRGPPGLKGDKGQNGERGMMGLNGEPGLSLSPPKVKVPSPVLTVNESQDAVLVCSFTGNPSPVIGWSKVEGRHSNASLALPFEGEKLILRKVNRDHSGLYQCKGTNILGVSMATTRLVISSFPIVALYNGPTYVKEGNNVILPKCYVKGSPQPKVTWYKAAGTLPRARTLMRNGILSILLTEVHDSGDYFCKAENDVGASIGRTQVVVVSLPAFIVKPPKFVKNIIGGTVTLPCQARAQPFPTITWGKQGGQLPPGRAKVKDGVLKVVNAQKADSGVYTCTATSAGVFFVQTTTRLLILARDCSDFYDTGERRSGVYRVDPDGQGDFQVFCDMTTGGGGWTVIQKRQDGTTDFYRNWNEYKSGFGDVNREFWLGNDHINRLTKRTVTSIRVDVENWSRQKAYALYSSFSIGAEAANYALSIGSYSGTAGDSLAFHNNEAFSTKDRDNDQYGGSCAVSYTGAWWYYSCYHSNLNGQYLGNNPDKKGAIWKTFAGVRSLKSSEMKIRPQSFSP